MSSTSKIRIGTRASKLALAQVAEVENLLKPYLKNYKIEVVKITTSGDRIQDRNLADIGGKGLFIKELEESLLNDKIDVAIHSAKDVPPFLHDETTIASFIERLDARDCFISKKFNSIQELPEGAVIGTSSARRKAILLSIRPDLKIVNFRGNVLTRLNKLENNEVDATILAACGLNRLSQADAKDEMKIACPKGYEDKKTIEKEEMLPAGGQGALIIQVRKSCESILQILQKINHQETEICVEAERAFLKELCASCATPVAAYASIENGSLNLKTIILDYDGSEIFKTESTSKANLGEAIKLGIAAANKTKDEAGELLKKICT